MAFPTSVNDQITDAVTQSNVKVLGDAPSIAMGAIYQATAHAAGIAAENAVANQQSVNELGIAVVTRCVNALVTAPRK
jgi:hypothetical protein